MKQIVQTNRMPATGGFPFSTAVTANGFLFISGQVGIDPVTHELVQGGFEAEAHQVMKNLGLILEETGLSYSDLVAVTVYLKDMRNFPRINEVYKMYFNNDYPTRTCIAVADLPVGASVELTAQAVLRK